MTQDKRPRLTLGHTTLAARDLDRLSAFYCDVRGFRGTNRGPVPGDSEIAFLSQDPTAHHQIAMVAGPDVQDSAFVMVDHLAFRTGTLDDLRAVHARLDGGDGGVGDGAAHENRVHGAGDIQVRGVFPPAPENVHNFFIFDHNGNKFFLETLERICSSEKGFG